MAKAEQYVGAPAWESGSPSAFSPELVLESLSEPVLACDLEGEVQYLNAAARRQIAFGLLPRAEELSRELFLCLDIPSGSAKGGDAVSPGGQLSALGVTMSHAFPGGDHRSFEFVATPMHGAGGTTVGVVFSISNNGRQRSNAMRRLLHDATHDELTGLVNRRELIKRLRRLVRHRNEPGQHALFFMDLDKFKQINDTCGHRAGDEALRRVAKVLRSNLRGRDTLGRLGGDEFVLLMEHCPEHKAMQTAHLLTAAMRAYCLVWGGQRFQVGISIGIVPVCGAAKDPEALLAEAELACYHAKRSRG
ncbi:MAG: diguanylate cyclase, partial [Proteobacteria bacterium]|nr:diguanylate cyclase [Pseudomonadota bacterium]